ncbi:hypothetical protein IKG31_01185 [Candidatus Saccharibacteria bacterium]|nr:hypothetical protein [Candidatus Saccharibacteria bacterium]
MDRLRLKDLIPVTIFAGLDDIRSDKDLRYLGKENLQYLAKFWESRKKKFADKRDAETDPFKRDDYQNEVDDCESKRNYLMRLALQSKSKPPFLEKRIFYIGSKVVFFSSSPDQYIKGIIVKVYVDEESETGSFSIRIQDDNMFTGSYELQYTPDGMSLFLAKDFHYYCTHPDYFRYVLNYYSGTRTLSEITYIERMVAALPQSGTSSAASKNF